MLFRKLYQDVKSSNYVIKNFVNQDLTVKYRRSALGFFWSLLNPLGTMFVTAIVFGSLLGVDMKTYAVFLYAGGLPFTFFSLSSTSCCSSIMAAEGYIKKIHIPKIVFPLSMLLSNGVNMLLQFIALFALALLLGAKISIHLFFLPISVIILFFFTTGFGLLMATVSVFFRDTPHLISVVMNAWYYLTPILFPIENMPPNVQTLLHFNPMFYMVDLFRAPICRNEFPLPINVLIASLAAIAMFMIGLIIFYRKERTFVYRL